MIAHPGDKVLVDLERKYHHVRPCVGVCYILHVSASTYVLRAHTYVFLAKIYRCEQVEAAATAASGQK